VREPNKSSPPITITGRAADPIVLAFRMPLTVVFILSGSRSGSTWLSLVLGNHDWAMNLGEYWRFFLPPADGACRFCQAMGAAECSVLYGIDNIRHEDAFHFAAERSGKQVIVDASKRLDWCRQFVDRDDMDIRLVHLVRHPCGYVESEGRRQPEVSHAALLDDWVLLNRRIEEFIAQSGRPSCLVCYDDLADDPKTNFPPLCAFIGHPWNRASLEYWKVPHHGLGGNGAATVYLRKHRPGMGETGDDAFYAGIETRPTTSDTRWRDRLSPEFRRHAVNTEYAIEIKDRIGLPRFLP
jgi:hypothetical protein